MSDLNKRVARACGFQVNELHRGGGPVIVRDGFNDPLREFDPETSAQDAILAAEKFGLFGEPHYCRLLFDDNQWSIWKPPHEDDLFREMRLNVTEAKFSRAVSQAIGRLAGE